MSRLPFQFDVAAKYGAPMGRYSEPLTSMVGKVRLCRVPLVDGGCYDSGGAYWGAGKPLFCAWNFRAVDGEMRVCYFRAYSRADAKAQLPGCTFYR